MKNEKFNRRYWIDIALKIIRKSMTSSQNVKK